jgi:hypothetical protein
MTRETVDRETPATRATSSRVGDIGCSWKRSQQNPRKEPDFVLQESA